MRNKFFVVLKKNLGQKSKKYCVQKKIGTKIFGLIEVLTKKKLIHKIKSPKNLFPKSLVKIGSVTPEILLQNIGSQKFDQNSVSNS